jgi:single-stranded-DNA-specific exonuclease
MPEPPLADLLDLVALGTVADVARLDANNRTLSAQGIARIRAGAAAPGIAALVEVARRDPRRVSAYDLASSSGRGSTRPVALDDMSIGSSACSRTTRAARSSSRRRSTR